MGHTVQMSELIKRIDEFYVGFKSQGANDLPLAFLTPYDTTAAFKKRKETVDTWSRGYGRYVNGKYEYDKQPDPINVKNEPMDGFKIAKSVKRTGGWNSGNVVWRIEDPRGFEWEIPSANLAQIITQTGISAGGVINGRCVIGRLGSNNILIPEGTDLWDQMNTDMATREKKANAKLVSGYQKGQWITLKNGVSGWYMGKEKVNLSRRFPSRPGPIGPSDDEFFLFVTQTNYGWYNVLAYKKLAVIEFDSSKVLSPTEEADIRKGGKSSFNFAGAPPVENAHIAGLL